MAEIINLNRARKAHSKAEAQLQAKQNRITYGRTKAEKETAARNAELETRRLEGGKVEVEEE